MRAYILLIYQTRKRNPTLLCQFHGLDGLHATADAFIEPPLTMQKCHPLAKVALTKRPAVQDSDEASDDVAGDYGLLGLTTYQ